MADPENTRGSSFAGQASTAAATFKPADIGIVDLLTRAADAAGTAAAVYGVRVSVVIEPAPGEPDHTGVRLAVANTARRFAASGPDHWRAVETLIRAMLLLHDQTADRWCLNPMLNRPYGQPVEPCPALEALRPLAEQVLQHLGDTE